MLLVKSSPVLFHIPTEEIILKLFHKYHELLAMQKISLHAPEFPAPGCIHCGCEVRLWSLLPIFWDSRRPNHSPFQIQTNRGQHKEQNQSTSHQYPLYSWYTEVGNHSWASHVHLCSELVHPITDRAPRTERVEPYRQADSLWSITKCKPERKTSLLPGAQALWEMRLVLVNSWRTHW